MKALVKARAESGIWMQDIPEPKVGHNDVLIKVRRSAICGTDMHIFNWDAWAQKTIPVPMAVGHEYAGEIVEIGSEVRGFQVGDRVSGEGHITCGNCRNCRAGRRHLCRNTAGVGVNRPGSFAEYLAIARHRGARHVVITDINDYRLQLAAKMGATRVLNVARASLDDAMKDLDMTEGFDVGFEMSGHQSALREMLRTMNNGGRISMLGIPPGESAIDWNPVIFKGLIIKGIYGREMFETWYKMSAMLQSGLNVRPVITHRLGVRDYLEGFEIMNSGKSGKITLDWASL
jgi:threonine 3-dehydrogenase